MLATSREAFRISQEREYLLEPLPEAPAVELLRHRAAAVAPDVDIDYALAVEICLQLDCLPLAIELAAARAKVFEPEELLARLERRLPVLVTRARDVPERQRALQATILWSYELLDEDEARVLRALAVFRGGATLAAIEVVVGASPELVESLVDKSLLRHRRGRLVLLETVREFALEELEASGEASSVRQAHAAYFLALAESANLNAGNLRPGGQRLEIAITEQDNIRRALDWALESRDLELGLRLLTAMEQFLGRERSGRGSPTSRAGTRARGTRRSRVARGGAPVVRELRRYRGPTRARARALPPAASRSSTNSATSTAEQSCCIASASPRCSAATSRARGR
jgi:predicted ATPase